MQSKKILFYDDADALGGHEISALDAIKYLLNHPTLNIAFVYSEANARLQDRLRKINLEKKLELHPIKYQSPKIKLSSPLLSIPKVLRIRKLLAHINPDVIIVVQGNIELCHLGLLAAKIDGYRTVSFIPLAHELSSVGRAGRVKTFLRRQFHSILYRTPDQFITTALSTKNALMKRGAHCKISVVYYGPDIKELKKRSKEESRRKLGLNDKDYVAAMIGRIQFRQKAHDFALEAVTRSRDVLGHFKLMIVGDGPDESRLRSMVVTKALTDLVYLVPWSSDLSHIYSAIDVLLVPSRYEGMPLVMLEAMYYEIPIVASNRDGMAEVLPKEWLFEAENAQSMVDALLRVRKGPNRELLAKNKQRVTQEFNVDKFGEKFSEALFGEGTTDTQNF